LTDLSERFKPDRLNAVSDGIFSVALTLLILDIKPPSTSSANLGEALLMLAPQFGVFALSFAIVAYFWVIHHLIFLYIRTTDRSLLWTNLLFLLCVVVLPFSAALLARYPMEPVALRFYGFNIAACSSSLWLAWILAVLNAKHLGEVSRVQRAYIMKRFALSLTLALMGAAVASILPVVSVILFVAVPVAYALTSGPQEPGDAC
jgi:uncharacterized membrane protein